MKTWIFMAASTGAAVYLCDSITHSVKLARRIHYRRSAEKGRQSKPHAFAHYLAEEMDIACGAGTDAKLALFADAEMLGAILRNMTRATKSAVVQALKVPALSKEVECPEFPEGCWSATRILRVIAEAHHSPLQG